jgi:hypothetical protein
MFLAILVLITALAISTVAIYYSVAGLVAIFAAAAVPIMIMGSVLEIGKLVTAVWLHRYWHQAKWWLKYYLVTAVLVLMFITSMGIFGFLSKAHIEQTANATEGLAQIERIETEIQRQISVVQRAEQEIIAIQTAGVQTDNTIQEQIDREQQRIDTAYARVQPAIDEQLSVIQREESAIAQRVETFQVQMDQINLKLSELTDALNSGDTRRAQGIVGARQDGALGPNTSSAIQSFRDNEESKRNELLDRIESIRTAPNAIVSNARDEIARLRNIAESQIEQSNALINRLRAQLGVVDVQSINQGIAAQESIIADSSIAINTLIEQKYTLQAEYRALEAEVGPIKYIAEFIYGDTDKMLLEEAVRWVIIIIIFVFDPLAVLLLIASQATFEIRKNERQAAEAKQEIINDNQSNDSKHDEHAQSSNRDPNSTTPNDSCSDSNNKSIDIVAYAEWIGTNDNERSVDRSRREERYEQLENSDQIKHAKQAWKEDHPDQTIKVHKDLYIQGKIDELPWEGYVQNSEQNPNSIWNKIKNNDNN